MDGKKLSSYISFALIAIIFILAFIILRPILLSIVSGLLLTYVLYPVYTRLLSVVKERNTASLIICFLLVFLILIPSWFLIPVVARQIFSVYNAVQKANFAETISDLIPGSTVSTDFYTVINSFISKLVSSVLSESTSILLNFQTILLHAAVIFFVLFFALRDAEALKSYVRSLSPLSSETEDIFFNKFKDVTNSVLYGQIIVGIIQGLVAGIGYIIFGVSNMITLTLFTIFFGLIPMVGPAIVWLPVVIFLFATGQTTSAIGLLIYGLLVVSTVDNLIRPYIVSKKTKLNSGIIVVGLIGGLFVFGILGLILGPLILAYSLVILEFYRNRKI